MLRLRSNQAQRLLRLLLLLRLLQLLRLLGWDISNVRFRFRIGRIRWQRHRTAVRRIATLHHLEQVLVGRRPEVRYPAGFALILLDGKGRGRGRRQLMMVMLLAQDDLTGVCTRGKLGEENETIIS